MTKTARSVSPKRLPGCFTALFILAPVYMYSDLYQANTTKTISSKINKIRMSSKEVNNPIGIRPYPNGLQSSLHAMPG